MDPQSRFVVSENDDDNVNDDEEDNDDGSLDDEDDDDDENIDDDDVYDEDEYNDNGGVVHDDDYDDDMIVVVVMMVIVGKVMKPESRSNQSPKQGNLRLPGPLSVQGAGGGTRTRDRGVPANLRADSLAIVPPTSPIK
ncbi:hypothetical protein PoB_005740400 [Plakobranchus ocellatus]|uniref:Uncharacterized protein n=1 Tax=Plakobranchus ocellatus TaxID=259542 RepID=A0AAV4CJ73_9GAST|nr:hypothetical protein PoB_005740400 [Plakobranchus ocellatus]